MPAKIILDESAVISDYQKVRSARICAEKYGVSNQTIYRILERKNIPRVKPKSQKRILISNCRSKYCPALIVMLRVVLQMKTQDIADVIGASCVTAVTSTISRKGVQKEKPVTANDVDVDAIEAAYLEGTSTYELGEKYGVNHSTISKWMVRRGCGKGKGRWVCNNNPGDIGRETQRARAIEKIKKRLLDETDGNIELLEYVGNKSRFTCKTCGCIFVRCSRGNKHFTCPDCATRLREVAKKNKERELEAAKAERKAELEAEYAKEKKCKSCGKVFHSEYPTRLYCCDTCSRREKRHRDAKAGKMRLSAQGHRKRARKYGVPYEPGITIKKLIKRDKNICQICGGYCDASDNRWGEHFGPLYPTIDHIIAMVNGGGHTWGNVQLAHAICNSTKRDLTEKELTSEVIAHAKEQAIAYKCA